MRLIQSDEKERVCQLEHYFITITSYCPTQCLLIGYMCHRRGL